MIRCIKFKPYVKNTLKGFADLELTRVGITIKDCTLHEKNGREWVGFPARAYKDKDGHSQWSPVVEFAASAGSARDAFQEQAVEAIHKAAAGAADDDAA